MPNARYQIVIIKPQGEDHPECFREIAETLCFAFKKLGFSVRLMINELDPEANNVILGWHLLEDSVCFKLGKACILYNLEQMDQRNLHLITRLKVLVDRCNIWDYSARNIKTLRAHGITGPIGYVPIGYVPEMTRIKSEPIQGIDVLFYGALSPRRVKILDELRKAGIAVSTVCGVFGAARDALIARAKIVINLHYYDASIFEMIRVSYLFANRKAVLAECNAETEVDEGVREAGVLVPSEQIVSACIRMLQDSDLRHEIEERGFKYISSHAETDILKRLLEGTTLDAFENDPSVSVVLPTKDRPLFLGRALRSIQEQTFTDLEVIVVNDGGEDVGEVVDAFRTEGLRITLHTEMQSGGIATARNTGVRLARGHWIAYLDDDDFYYPEHLQVLVSAMRETGIKVAYSDSVQVVEDFRNGQWRALSRELRMSCDFDRGRLLKENITPIINVMHERICWEICGSMDETLPILSDWDYLIRFSSNWEFMHIPQPTAEVRWRANGTNSTIELQAIRPKVLNTIQAKVRLLSGMPEALLYEPDWTNLEWAEVILSYARTFAAGEPVALILVLDPKMNSEMTLEQAQSTAIGMMERAGRESFPDIIVIDNPEELLDTLRAYERVQWVPRSENIANYSKGSIGWRLAQARPTSV